MHQYLKKLILAVFSVLFLTACANPFAQKKVEDVQPLPVPVEIEESADDSEILGEENEEADSIPISSDEDVLEDALANVEEGVRKTLTEVMDSGETADCDGLVKEDYEACSNYFGGSGDFSADDMAAVNEEGDESDPVLDAVIYEKAIIQEFNYAPDPDLQGDGVIIEEFEESNLE